MCGIAGICNLSASSPIVLEDLQRMVAALQHRGPDEAGIYLDDAIGLGSARLSIIDIAGGAQPLGDEGGNSWIVYNGEIFNYPELKEGLLRRRRRFKTATDTEVLLHLYLEKGAACLHELNGQFACAIWNAKTRELFLARDRVGVRPLYYTVAQGLFIFASEIKAILAVNGAARRIDPVAMDQIFTFWATLPGYTVFAGVHELPPAHYLRLAHGAITIKKYWEIPFCPRHEHQQWSAGDLCSATQEVLADAVKIRLRADVPVGCYLSGGLDSSIVAALAQKHYGRALRTFGIGFEDKAFDESAYQNEMARFAGTQHAHLVTTNGQIAGCLPEAIWHGETPVLRTSPAPLYLLAHAVRQSGLKVALTGEGADEIFGGYDIFREAKARRFWAQHPESKFRHALIDRLYPYLFGDPGSRRALKSFFGSALENTAHPFFSHALRWRTTSRAKALFSAEFRQAARGYDGCEELRGLLPAAFASWENLAQAQYLEIKILLSNFLLSAQGDRMAMAHGVETRMPFLDHRVIEFMSRVPAKWKIRGMREKFILKKTFRHCLPEKIVSRPKQPYRAPLKPALLHDGWPMLRQQLAVDSLRQAGLFDPARVQKFVHKLERQARISESDGMALTGIVSAQLVHERFIANFSRPALGMGRRLLIIDRRSI